MRESEPAPGKRSVRKRVIRRILLVWSLVSGAVCLSMLLAFQCRPSWYNPVAVGEEVLRRAQRESAGVIDDTGRHLVRREAYEVSITQQQINEWLAAMPKLWPRWGNRLPEDVRNLAAKLEPGRIRIGALVDRGGVRVVLNGALRISLANDGHAIRIELEQIRGGKLAVPRRLISAVHGLLDDSEGSDNEQGTSIVDLFDGVDVPNDFIWPNGERRFRIADIRIEPGGVHLRLEPL